MLGPLNSLLLYVTSSRYIWSLAPIFFLQEQIKDIIISDTVFFLRMHTKRQLFSRMYSYLAIYHFLLLHDSLYPSSFTHLQEIASLSVYLITCFPFLKIIFMSRYSPFLWQFSFRVFFSQRQINVFRLSLNPSYSLISFVCLFTVLI